MMKISLSSLGKLLGQPVSVYLRTLDKILSKDFAKASCLAADVVLLVELS